MKIILASGSPRRREMLEKLGIPFEVMTCKKDEKNHKDSNFAGFRHLAMENARMKVQEVFEQFSKDNVNRISEEAVLIGADTVVVADNHLLPKPVDDEDAKRMLRLLSGRTHRVITGIALIKAPEETVFEDYEETQVTFRSLSSEDVERYVATGECRDKAGAYGIQGYGVFLVESIQGDYNNVVGLPLMKLYHGLRRFNLDLMEPAAGNGSIDRKSGRENPSSNGN